MSVPVAITSKASSDLAIIYDHQKKYNGATKARQVVKDLLAEAKKLGFERRHRIGEELDGYDGPPAREIHKDVCLAGDYELHYEIIPPYANIPSKIVVLRVWGTRQDR